MRKILIIFLFYLTPLVVFAQDAFVYDKDYIITKHVIINADEQTSTELYAKTKEWVSKNYVNDSEVIQADIPDRLIRIKGICPDCIRFNSLGMVQAHNIGYNITFEFKEGRYRMTLDKIFYQANGYDIDIDNLSYAHKKNGTPRAPFKYFLTDVEAVLKKVVENNRNYVLGKNNENDNW